MQTDQNRSTKMNTMHEDLARAQMRARLGEAQQLRRGYQMALANVSAARLSGPHSRRDSRSLAPSEKPHPMT